MKLKKSSYNILPELEPTVKGIYKRIETVAKVCTDTQIGEDNEKFVNYLIKHHHYSPLEFGTVYLTINLDAISVQEMDKVNRETFKRYSRAVVGGNKDTGIIYYITTTLRVLVENDCLYLLKYLTDPTVHIRRYTVKIFSSMQFYKDITRHRNMSFNIASTRLINFVSKKYDNELTFIEPSWFNDEITKSVCLETWQQIEDSYIALINKGWQPQQASTILPQGLAANIYMCGYPDDWVHVFALRSNTAITGKPHPQIEEIMTPLREEFIQNDYIKYPYVRN